MILLATISTLLVQFLWLLSKNSVHIFWLISSQDYFKYKISVGMYNEIKKHVLQMSRYFKIMLHFIVIMFFWIILYVIALHLINAFTQFSFPCFYKTLFIYAEQLMLLLLLNKNSYWLCQFRKCTSVKQLAISIVLSECVIFNFCAMCWHEMKTRCEWKH